LHILMNIVGSNAVVMLSRLALRTSPTPPPRSIRRHLQPGSEQAWRRARLPTAPWGLGLAVGNDGE
jgi:hypothetical protein